MLMHLVGEILKILIFMIAQLKEISVKMVEYSLEKLVIFLKKIRSFIGCSS